MCSLVCNCLFLLFVGGVFSKSTNDSCTGEITNDKVGFTAEQSKWLCERADSWSQRTSSSLRLRALKQGPTSKQAAWLSEVRGCRGTNCLSDVVKCVDKSCQEKEIKEGELLPEVIDISVGSRTRMLTAPRPTFIPFPDYSLQADDLIKVDVDKVDPKILLSDNEDIKSCEERMFLSNLCFEVSKSYHAETAFEHPIKASSKDKDQLTKDLEKKFKKFQAKCNDAKSVLKKNNKTYDDVKPCADIIPKLENFDKKSLSQRCVQVLKANTPLEAFPELKDNITTVYAQNLLADNYGRWVDRCRRARDILADETFESVITGSSTHHSDNASTHHSDNAPTHHSDNAPTHHSDNASTHHSDNAPTHHSDNDTESSTRIKKSAKAARSFTRNYPKSKEKSNDDPFLNIFKTNSPDLRAYRKDIRMLSDGERLRYFAAINHLKNDDVDGISKYDIFAKYHTPEDSPGAHFGPAFLPFHREFLKQYEIALRVADSSVALPYFDSIMDDGLPSAKDSILWTPEFFGNGNGIVTEGPFAHWNITEGTSGDREKTTLYRDVGDFPAGLFQPKHLKYVMESKKYDDLVFCFDRSFEGGHGMVHGFVGGLMGSIPSAANDPIFYMHHCFMDYVWEQFRQTQQTLEEREMTYTDVNRYKNISRCQKALQYQKPNDQMLPFPITNREGLNTSYTEELFFYQPRPTCSKISPFCSSPYLFCDTKLYRCLSKVKLNGNCKGFEGTDICYASTCTNGKCQNTYAHDL